jgi:rhomboid family GlyGly-CTERM serine protease
MARVVIKALILSYTKHLRTSLGASVAFPQLIDYRQWLALMLVLGPMMLIHGLGLDNFLKYHRDLIEGGDYSLLISGHFSHLSASHWLLNAGAFFLIWLYSRATVPLLFWAVATVLIAMGASLGLYMFAPKVLWYVGLSGVLHGLMVVVLYQLIRSNPNDPIPYVVTVGLIAKIAKETIYGPISGTAELAGLPVVVEAHLYGLITGVMVCIGAFFMGYRGRLQ